MSDGESASVFRHACWIAVGMSNGGRVTMEVTARFWRVGDEIGLHFKGKALKGEAPQGRTVELDEVLHPCRDKQVPFRGEALVSGTFSGGFGLCRLSIAATRWFGSETW